MAKQLNSDNLFDFINLIFIPYEYNKLSNYQKAKHGFMVNRFMSIQYPMQAAMLSVNKINTAEVIDFWAKTLRKSYNKTPYWMYIKTKKAREEKKKTMFVPEDITIKNYCKMYNCSTKEIKEAKQFWPDEMEQELKKLEKILKQ